VLRQCERFLFAYAKSIEKWVQALTTWPIILCSQHFHAVPAVVLSGAQRIGKSHQLDWISRAEAWPTCWA